ncbi:MAG: hypothetical protein GY810_24120 [Aureispira sp.]|nr:hypothetical protein [Aureispira sp.]
MKCTYIFLGTIFLFLLNSCGDTPQNPLKKILKDQSEHNYNYTIDNSKDTLLNTKDGLVLFIPQSCLTTKDGGPLTEAVTIEVSTFRDLTSILKEDLETISDDQLLISEGMFSIQAQTSSGQEIAINQDNPIQIIASLKYDNKDIMLFEEAQPNSSNWIAPQKPTGQSLVIPFETLWQNDVDIYNQGGTEIYTWIKEFYQDQCEDTTLCSFDLIKYQHSFIATNEFWTRYVADYYSGRDGFYQTSKSYRPNVTPWLSNSGSNLIDMYATQPVWAVDSFILEELKTNMNNLIKDSLNRLELHKQDVDNLDRRYIKLGSAPFTKAETANLVQLRIDDDQNYISNCREDIVIWENLKNQRLTQIDSSLLPAIDSNALRKIQKALEDEAKLSLMNRKSWFFDSFCQN